ncbi:hypothetical protein BV898_12109 [Hypsibius exemplaris]|uniref:Uncharacterized protein n=1 Tax=Hypsibius exemplaris TaxID=2072580 RepID=A0A1W0WEN0_HYPEX|nr:hypothetical protein BV898_12109 [Hypsibius exemplaris]
MEDAMDLVAEDINTRNPNEHLQSYPLVLFGILCLKFSLPQKAMAAFLELLKLRADFSSVKSIEDILLSLEMSPMKVHIICRSCGANLETDVCSIDCTDTVEDTFITASINSQLQHILRGESLFVPSDLNFRQGDRIRDMTDGSAYRSSHCRSRERLGLVSDTDKLLTMVINTDGLQINESGGKSAWPVFGMISEIHPDRRAMNDKILNLALWEGEGKPPIVGIMREINEQIEEINETGLRVRTAGCDSIIFLHAPALIADMPAEAMLRNAINFNGAFGCSLCTIEGVSVPSGYGHCRAYIAQAGEEVQRRTHENVVQHAQEAVDSGYQVFGQKGIPLVHPLRHLDYSNCFLLDEMHCFLIGTVKKVLTMWTENSAEPYFLNKDAVEEIERRLMAFRPPKSFTRLPRKLKIAKYKANEFRSFINHYSVFCLNGILPARYLDHWRLLVAAYKTLSTDSIHPAELAVADDQLSQFCEGVAMLYDRDAKELEKQILTAAGKRTCTALAKNYLADIKAAATAQIITPTDELQIPQPAVRATAAGPVDTATSTTARHEPTPSDAGNPTNSTNNTQMLVQYTPFPAQSSGGGFPGSVVHGGSPVCLDLSGPSYLPSTSARFDSHANSYIVGENRIQHPYLMSHYTSPPTQHYGPATPYTSASLPNPNDPSEEIKVLRKKLEQQESEFKSLSEQVKLVLERDPKHVKVEKKDPVLLRMLEKPHVSHAVREGMRLLLTREQLLTSVLSVKNIKGPTTTQVLDDNFLKTLQDLANSYNEAKGNNDLGRKEFRTIVTEYLQECRNKKKLLKKL